MNAIRPGVTRAHNHEEGDRWPVGDNPRLGGGDETIDRGTARGDSHYRVARRWT